MAISNCASQPSVERIWYSVVVLDMIQSLHFFRKFSGFCVQAGKYRRKRTNGEGKADHTDNQKKNSKKLFKWCPYCDITISDCRHNNCSIVEACQIQLSAIIILELISHNQITVVIFEG